MYQQSMGLYPLYVLQNFCEELSCLWALQPLEITQNGSQQWL